MDFEKIIYVVIFLIIALVFVKMIMGLGLI